MVKIQFISKYLILLTLTSSTGWAKPTEEAAKFDPQYEGAARVRLKCQNQDTSPRCATIGNQTLRMIVFNNYRGILIQFFNEDRSYSSYRFWAHNFESNHLVARADESSLHPAQELAIEFNEDKTLRGWIRDTEFKYDLQFTGVRDIVPYDYFNTNHDRNKLTESSSLIGEYVGVFHGPNFSTDCSLTVKKSALDDGFLVTFRQQNTPNPTRDYVVSRFYPEYAAFVLVGVGGVNPNGKGMSKLVFSVLESPNGQIQLNGIEVYTDDSGYNTVLLRRKN